MTAQLAPLPVAKFFDNNGFPLAFGLLTTYAAGTTNKIASYIDSTQTTPNTNPVQLNFRGECALWLDPSLSYKIALTDVNGNQIPGWPVDNVPGGFGANPLSISLIPNPSNTFTLGNATNSWANAYLGPNRAPVLDSVSGNIGYYARTAAEIAAPVTPINYSKWPSPWKDISRFVTDNTGATDVTAQFMNAIKAERSIVIPEGVYLLNQTTVANILTLTRSNVEIIGVGPSSQLIHTASGVVTGTQGVIQITPASGTISGLYLANFRITGPTPNTGAAPNATNRMQGISFHDNASANNITDVIVDNVIVENMEMACFGLGGVTANSCLRINFSRCVARASRQDGFNDYAANTDIVFQDCYAYDTDGFGHEHASSSLIIDGGYVRRTGQSGIGLAYNATLGANKRKIIRNVTISDITTVATPDASGISLGQAISPFNTEISNCNISRIGGYGIVVNGGAPDQIDIVDNRIYDVGGNNVNNRGIQITSPITNSSIIGNKIASITAGYHLDYGIVQGGAGSATNLIQGNDIGAATVQKIFAAAPTRIFRGILPNLQNSGGTGNVGAGETILMSYSVPANTLETTNQSIKITAWGSTAANANTKQVRIYFGATVICDTTAIAANAKPWRLEATIAVATAAIMVTNSGGQFNGVIQPAATAQTGGQSFTIANLIKVTGTATANNDVTESGLLIEFPETY